jgi:hypothetical protein
MLTEGGGFSLQKGAGTLGGCVVDGSLSNKHPMNRSTLAWVSPLHNKEFIRSKCHIIGN